VIHVARRCEHCARPFIADREPSTHNPLRFCSRGCAAAARRGKPIGRRAQLGSPPSPRIRNRASGLVNQRIRRGWAVPPIRCQLCKLPGKLDKHHPDYQRPDLVAFLCRSCHMRAHSNEKLNRRAAEVARCIAKAA